MFIVLWDDGLAALACSRRGVQRRVRERDEKDSRRGRRLLTILAWRDCL
jgi:hypothetical protein